RGRDLPDADPDGDVSDLALQVRQLHHIVVDDAQRADPGRRQIQHEWGAEAARTDHQHPRVTQLGLADAADFGQQDVPRVAADFVFCEIEVHGLTIWGAGFGCESSAPGMAAASLQHPGRIGISNPARAHARIRPCKTMRLSCSPAVKIRRHAWPGRWPAIPMSRPSDLLTGSVTPLR